MANYWSEIMFTVLLNFIAVGMFFWSTREMEMAKAPNVNRTIYVASLSIMLVGTAIVFTVWLEVSLVREVSFRAAVAIGLLMAPYSAVALMAVASWDVRLSYARYKDAQVRKWQISA